jgi:hypothetical protein
MTTKILSSKKNELVIEIKIPLETSMLDGEQTLEKSLRNAHGITSATITQNYCFRWNDLRRRIVTLRNDLRSFHLGQ